MRICSHPMMAAVLAAVVGVPLMGGCSLFTSHDSASTLITAPNPPIADVPVPAGFSLITKMSTSKVIPSSNVRFVDHQYSGPDDYLPVVGFYKDKLPAGGWTMVDQTQTRSDISLHFTKGSEDCFVTVKAPTLHTHTHIRIQINPIGKVAGA